jgi:hypothetical protein
VAQLFSLGGTAHDFMFKLPPYDVIVWHRVHPASLGLHQQIVARAGRGPDEGIEMQGIRDMHWGFDTAEAAIAFAESLLELAASDDVIVLSIIASHDESFGRKVYKDSRASVSR